MTSISQPPISRPKTAPRVKRPMANAASAGRTPTPFRCSNQWAVKKKNGNWHAIAPTRIIQYACVPYACRGSQGNVVTRDVVAIDFADGGKLGPPSTTWPRSSGRSFKNRHATIADKTDIPATIAHACRQFPPFPVRIRLLIGTTQKPANPDEDQATAIVL